MAYGNMTPAVAGQPASSAANNQIITNVDDLDTRLDTVESRTTNTSGDVGIGNQRLSDRLGSGVSNTSNVTTGTASAQLTDIRSRLTVVESTTTNGTSGNSALNTRVTNLESAAGISVLFARKTADQAVSNTTLTNDTHLTFSVLANGVYTVEGYLLYQGAADPAGGLKVDFSGPSGATMRWTNFGTNQGTASPNTLLTYNVVSETISPGSPRTMGTNGTGGTIMSASPRGILTVSSTAGTFVLRFAQGTSNATATSLMTGSWLRLTKVA
jgi:hypothetical protein